MALENISKENISKLAEAAKQDGAAAAYDSAIKKIAKIGMNDKNAAPGAIKAITALTHAANNIYTHIDAMKNLENIAARHAAQAGPAIDAIRDLLKHTRLITLYQAAIDSIFAIAGQNPGITPKAIETIEPLVVAVNRVNCHQDAIQKLEKLGGSLYCTHYRALIDGIYNLAIPTSRMEIHMQAIGSIYNLATRAEKQIPDAVQKIALLTEKANRVNIHKDSVQKITALGCKSRDHAENAITGIYGMTIKIKDRPEIHELAIAGIASIAEHHPERLKQALQKLPALIRQANRVHLHIFGLKKIARLGGLAKPCAEFAVKEIGALTAETSKTAIYSAAIDLLGEIGKNNPKLTSLCVRTIEKSVARVTGPKELLEYARKTVQKLDGSSEKTPENHRQNPSVTPDNPIQVPDKPLLPSLEKQEEEEREPSEYYFLLRDWLKAEDNKSSGIEPQKPGRSPANPEPKPRPPAP